MYEVVRALHENEADDGVSEHVERLVNYLKREENADTKKDGEVEVDKNAKIEEEEEEEDNMIIEV